MLLKTEDGCVASDGRASTAQSPHLIMKVLTSIDRRSLVPLPPESITQAADFRPGLLDAGLGLPPIAVRVNSAPPDTPERGEPMCSLPSRNRHKDSLPANVACTQEHQGTGARAFHSHELMQKDTYPRLQFRSSGRRRSLLVPCVLRSSHINGIRFGYVRGSPPFRLLQVIEKEYFHLRFFQSPSTAHQ